MFLTENKKLGNSFKKCSLWWKTQLLQSAGGDHDKTTCGGPRSLPLNIKSLTCRWKYAVLGGREATRNAAKAKQKRSSGLHISLRDLCFTARIIWRRPAHSCCLSPTRVLHLTSWLTVQPPTQLSMPLPASTVAGGEGARGGLGDVFAVRKHRAPQFSLLLIVFPSSKASIFSPFLCACGRENKDKDKAEKRIWRSRSR